MTIFTILLQQAICENAEIRNVRNQERSYLFIYSFIIYLLFIIHLLLFITYLIIDLLSICSFI